MHMLDVMRRLNSASAVQLLLCIYAETLQRHDPGRSLPGTVTALPIAGAEDVRCRLETLLEIELNGCVAKIGERAYAIACEAVEVFGAALARMQTLQADPCLPPAKVRELVF